MANPFSNRVYGFALVRSINSNYNADFTHQPRTLPSGVVYATDKAFKFAVKHYITKEYPGEKVLYFKRLKDDFIPMSLEESYADLFPDDKERKKDIVAKNILGCFDVRSFGATFAMKGKGGNVAISIHGPVQVNHGLNIWKENNIFTEQISSPFRNPDERAEEKEATTLGRQSKLEEGHYIHHFSINPKNLKPVLDVAGEGATPLLQEDVEKLKEGFRLGVSYYDSAQKAGTDNEVLLWVQLKPESKRVLPNFTRMVGLDKNEEGLLVVDCSRAGAELERNADQIEAIEVYYVPEQTVIQGLPDSAQHFNLVTGQPLNQ